MKKVSIYLGSKCNMSCKYCHREVEKDTEVSEELLNWISKQEPLNIHFYGGEPTLYMDTVRKVVDIAPNGSEFSLTTNGILFPKYRDYFLEHNFLIAISYDGTENSLRGYDPFSSVIDYPKIAVSLTLYHGNTDFLKIIKNLTEKEKIVGRRLSFFPHIMHTTNEKNKEYALTKEDMREIFGQYKKYVSQLVLDYEKYNVINNKFMGIFNELWRRIETSFSFGETYCIHKNMEKVNVNGDRFNCLYIRNDSLPLEEVDQKEAMKEIIRAKYPSCITCDLYALCGCACIKSIEHDIECYYYKMLYGWWKEFYKEHKETIDDLGELFYK